MSSSRPPGLIQRYREELEARHYARRTVKTDEQWLRRFLKFHRLRHPREMGSEEVHAFLTYLAVELKVSASTQNQALAALLFLYRQLLERDLDLGGGDPGAHPTQAARSDDCCGGASGVGLLGWGGGVRRQLGTRPPT